MVHVYAESDPKPSGKDSVQVGNSRLGVLQWLAKHSCHQQQRTNSGDRITKNSPQNDHPHNRRTIGNLECHNSWAYRLETFCWCVHLFCWFLLVLIAIIHHHQTSGIFNHHQTAHPQAAYPNLSLLTSGLLVYWFTIHFGLVY